MIKTQYNRERLAGALEALGECGIEDYEKYIVRDVESEDDAYYKTLELMRHEERPTGVFMFNDFYGLRRIQGYYQKRIKDTG